MDWFEIEDVRSRKAKPVLEVPVEVVPNDVDIMPHISASRILPVAVYLSVFNKSPALVEYLQLHVWFHERVHWDPEEETIEPWQSQGPESLPSEWELYEALGHFQRVLLHRTPADGFFLMQSQHPVTLKPLAIVFRHFVPMVPMPWKPEVPGMKALTGALLFWMNHSGRFKAETITADTDHAQVLRKAHCLAQKDRRH